MECPICKETMDTDAFLKDESTVTATTIRLKCGHASHSKCIAEWWASQESVGCFYRCEHTASQSQMFDDILLVAPEAALPQSFYRHQNTLCFLNDVWTLTDEQCQTLRGYLNHIHRNPYMIFIPVIGVVQPLQNTVLFECIGTGFFHILPLYLPQIMMCIQTIFFLSSWLNSLVLTVQFLQNFVKYPRRRMMFVETYQELYMRNSAVITDILHFTIYLIPIWIRFGYFDREWIEKLGLLFQTVMAYLNAT